MKRTLSLLVLALMIFSSASYAAMQRGVYSNRASSAAPDRVGRWDLGMFMGGAFNADADTTGFFGGQVAYGVTPWIALGLEAGWQEGQVSADADQDLGMVPILADFIVRFPNVNQTLVPYGVLGLGVIETYVTDNNGSGSNNGKDSHDTAFGWKLGAGADWFLNENWIMNFELAYYDASAKLSNSAAGSYNFWGLTVGLKYLY